MNKFTVYVYKQDRRCKSGERAAHTSVHEGASRATLEHLYATTWFASEGYRFEIVETTRKVKNLMTGAEIEIDHDTPHCCDPSSETYWSM